jgi:hypothetical protein
MRRALFLTAALSMATAWTAAAQDLTVEFHDGRVSVDATAVPVRAILTEWGKIGGTKIIGAEKITGAPLTVKLIDVPEAQALETILRSVAGYMAAPRNGSAGSSTYDRILVMATSTAPPPVARPAAGNNNGAFNGTQRFVPPRPIQQREQPELDEEPEQDENPPGPPVFTFPPPGQNGFQNQPGQINAAPQPGQINGAPQNGQPVIINPATGTTQPDQPQAPIGVSRPGMMVAPPPPQNQPNQPGMIRRPPGGGE